MIKEEFDWSQVSDYLENNVTTAFIGPSHDDRSHFFPNVWSKNGCKVVHLEASKDASKIKITVLNKGIQQSQREVDLIIGLRAFLMSIRGELRVTCLDLSSLQHTTLMYLTKLLIQEVKPARLFASYAEPVEYLARSYLGDFHLSEELLGLRAVPGFARRMRTNPTSVLALLGFEGERLIKIMEDMPIVPNVIPVIGFPSFRPGWQSHSLRNCMRAIDYAKAVNDIHKCSANSIFSALKLITDFKPSEGTTYALAPLGTRAHSMACAIYVSRHPETHIIYDHPVELPSRSIGVHRCKCYHLSSFILH